MIGRFLNDVMRCGLPDVAQQARAIADRLRRRKEAQTRGEEFKYVNVTGGACDSPRLTRALEFFRAAGYGAYLDKVPGPLFRSTHGKVLTHMPLAVGSSYTHVIGALKSAWKISSQMEEDDLELDLAGLDEPKWGHHTFRRTADKMARATLDVTGAVKEDLDDMFGWKQAERAKDMQSHYAGRKERSVRARITMMI